MRLRHRRVVGACLLCLQFGVLVPSAVTRPGIPIPGLSVCALPGCLHPSPTPPRPPFQGGAGGGELGGGDWGVLGCPFWDLAGGGRWDCMAAFPRGAGACLRASCAVHHYGAHGSLSLASPRTQRHVGGVFFTLYGCSLGCLLPQDVRGFRLLAPPGPVGEGGRGELAYLCRTPSPNTSLHRIGREPTLPRCCQQVLVGDI